MSPSIKQHAVSIVALIILLILGIVYVSTTKSIMTEPEPVMCTMDAKQCPDGSYVGRVAPSCEFAACPVAQQRTRSSEPALIPTDLTASTTMQLFTLPTADVTIRYGESVGFIPATTTIKQYQTIDFINASNVAFWPVSDEYPNEERHPEFDSKNPITPGNKFTYTFNTTGTWRYHNSFKPEQHGVIIVTPVTSATTTRTTR